MTSTELLALAGVITKDPDHAEYTSAIKYSMLTSGYVKLAHSLNKSLLDDLKKKVTLPDPFVQDSTFTTLTITDFLSFSYLETTDAVPVRFISIEQFRAAQNTHFGGDDSEPLVYSFLDGADRKLHVEMDTLSKISGTDLFYIKEPATLSDAQDPELKGYDDLVINYFKYMFHIAEGQTDLASAALNAFESGIQRANGELN